MACWIDTPAGPIVSIATLMLSLIFMTVLLVWQRVRNERTSASAWRAANVWSFVLQELKFIGFFLAVLWLASMPPFINWQTSCPPFMDMGVFGIMTSIFSWLLPLGETINVLIIWIPAIFRNYFKLIARVSAVEDNLSGVLGDGTIRLISIDWLLSQPEEFVLSRRQALPPEAHVSPAMAIACLNSGKIAALSYRWLEELHPDPNGFHLRALRNFLNRDGNRRRWTALMMDFVSLPQKDGAGERTSEEAGVFNRGLSSMGSVYASPRIAVLQHKELPADAKHRIGYDSSGWCTFEARVASLATMGGGRVYDLVKGRVLLRPGVRKSAEEMEAIFLSDQVYFYGSADRPKVAAMYAELLKRVEPLDAPALEKRIAADACFLSHQPTYRRARACRAVVPVVMTMLLVLYLCLDKDLDHLLDHGLSMLLVLLAFVSWMKAIGSLTQSPSARQYFYDVACCVPAIMRTHELSCSLGCLLSCGPPLVAGRGGQAPRFPTQQVRIHPQNEPLPDLEA